MEALNKRITIDNDVLGGKPVIRGLRIRVEQILRAMAAGVSPEDLLVDYPELEQEDMTAVLLYAARDDRRHASVSCGDLKMTLQLLVDVNVGKAVEQWLRDNGYDIVAVRDIDPSLADSVILERGLLAG